MRSISSRMLAKYLHDISDPVQCVARVTKDRESSEGISEILERGDVAASTESYA